MNLTELAGAAGLLLVTVLGRGDLGDGLTVRNLRSVKLDVLLELVVDSPLNIVDMLLAHTAEDGLAEFLGVLDRDGRILGRDLVEGVTHLGLVVLVDGLDGATVLGIREHHVLDGLDAALGEGHVGLAGLELHRAADVTGAELGNLLLLGTRDGVDGAEALTVAGLGVDEVGALVEGTGHHLEVGNLTEVLLDGGLEDEDRSRGGRVADNLATVDGLFLGTERRRNDVDDELHQAADTDVLLGGHAEDGDRLALHQAGAETFADLVGRELHRLEEFLHQFVGTFGGLLHQLGTEFFGLVSVCGGDVEFFVLVVVVLHCDDIHEALEVEARVDGELAEDGLLAELLVDGSADAVPVGLVMVELVDCDDHRDIILVGVAGEEGRTDLDAGRAVHHHDGGVDNLEGGKGTAGEIIRSRSIDEVDLGVVDLCVQGRRVDGLLVGLLELGVVGDGVLVLNGAPAVNDFAFEEHGFAERGLAGMGAAQKDHVADVLGLVILHFIVRLIF